MSEELPEGWRVVPLRDLAAASRYSLAIGPFGSSLTVPDYRTAGVPLVFVRDIRAGRFDRVGTKHVSPEKAAELRAHTVRGGDLLITKMGEPPGDTAVYPADAPDGIVTSDCIKMTVDPAQSSAEFLRRWLRAEPVRASILGATRGVAQQKLSLERFRDLEIPLPPRAEQGRISARLEPLLTAADRARRALADVPKLCEKLRKSVLASAFRGDLTAAWREANPDVEPASVLLDRIRAERRARWEAANPKKAYVAPKPVDPVAEELPELPEGWVWARLREIATIAGGVTKGQKRRPGAILRSVPYLRVANVQRGFLDLREITEIEATEAEINDLRLVRGDILFNEGGDRDKLGRGWIWSGEIAECIHQNHVFRARLLDEQVQPRLVSWWGNTFGKQFFFDEGKQSTNLASINITKLSELPVPLPPAEEQKAFAAAVETAMAVVDRLDAVGGASLKDVASLERAILAKAFRGGLVDAEART